MKYLKFLILLFFILSCQEEYNVVEKKLLDSNTKWVSYDKAEEFDPYKIKFHDYIKFKENGKYYYYYASNDRLKGKSENWRYFKDKNELRIHTFNFDVIKVYEDSIILKDHTTNRIVKLIDLNSLY